jgi:tetratricopeptide (TPR) repeat protein/predicted Ser/Thr protein kinase
VLAQLGAGGLTQSERGTVLDHAASCVDCHAVVAMFTRITLVTDSGDRTAEASTVTRIDRYELRRIVGRGAMGVVYAAFDHELAREVAVKLLGLRATAARLRREAQALARLTHPNVVRVYDVGEHAGRTFIAMELVEGENLREWLRTPHPLDEILAVLLQAGRGLAAAHAAGLVHRDFKPDNVLLARTGGVLVGDFGLARSAEAEAEAEAPLDDAPRETIMPELGALTATGAIVGTPAYMAPEQAAGEATPASDQYAFCVTAWEACFGQRPNAGAPQRKPGERAVPMRIERVLRRGLAPQPEARFESMNALLAALAPRPRRRWPWLAGGAIAIAGATAAVAWTASNRPSGVRCDDAVAALAPVWTPAVEAELTAKRSANVAQGFARYAASWQQQRIDACRATHERREQTVATLERRIACLDRARNALGATLDAVIAAQADALPRPANAVDGLPSLARCVDPAPQELAPPPERSAAIAVLDHELVALDVSLRSGAPSVSLAMASELRRRAEELGFPRQVLRAMLLEARVATWTGDAAAAETLLRRALVQADRTADDFTRAHASALLAHLLADIRLVEASGLVDAARSALARAGDDPAIAESVLEAEVALATSRGDHREAVAHQERLVAAIRARLGDDSPILLNAYNRLHVLWAYAGDVAQSVAAEQRALELFARLEPEGTPHDLTEAMTTSSLELIAAGDFEGAAAIDRRKLAMMRAQPAHPLKAEAYTVSQLGMALELDRNYRDALAAYREAEQLWSRPAVEFTTVGEQPDPAAITAGIVDAVESQGRSLMSLGRVADAVAILQRARELALAGGEVTRASVQPISRSLGVALVAAGRHREARELLAPMADALATDTELKPFPRARTLFALAQALWVEGGVYDRRRARALAADAERYLALAIADGEAQPFLRKLPALAREEQARIVSWRTAHP